MKKIERHWKLGNDETYQRCQPRNVECVEVMRVFDVGNMQLILTTVMNLVATGMHVTESQKRENHQKARVEAQDFDVISLYSW